jgi:hypothetical protein
MSGAGGLNERGRLLVLDILDLHLYIDFHLVLHFCLLFDSHFHAHVELSLLSICIFLFQVFFTFIVFAICIFVFL